MVKEINFTNGKISIHYSNDKNTQCECCTLEYIDVEDETLEFKGPYIGCRSMLKTLDKIFDLTVHITEWDTLSERFKNTVWFVWNVDKIGSSFFLDPDTFKTTMHLDKDEKYVMGGLYIPHYLQDIFVYYVLKDYLKLN